MNALYIMAVSRKIPYFALLIFLAVLQTVQGAFAGTTLCREESGKVVLEWSEGGLCETAGDLGIPCLNKSERAASDHCQSCLDVPLPSETSVKSLALSAGGFWIPVSAVTEFVLPQVNAVAFAPLSVLQEPTHEHLRSIRLLI